MGALENKLLMMSDGGYGFVTKIADLQSKNKAGKATLSLPKGAEVMMPVTIEDASDQYLVAVSNEGRMLVFPVRDLPELSKGKGNKIISIPSARVQSREELMVLVTVFSENDRLVIHSGKRHLKLRFSDLEHYLGERGRRGHKLPRGLQKVDRIEVLSSRKDNVDGDVSDDTSSDSSTNESE